MTVENIIKTGTKSTKTSNNSAQKTNNLKINKNAFLNVLASAHKAVTFAQENKVDKVSKKNTVQAVNSANKDINGILGNFNTVKKEKIVQDSEKAVPNINEKTDKKQNTTKTTHSAAEIIQCQNMLVNFQNKNIQTQNIQPAKKDKSDETQPVKAFNSFNKKTETKINQTNNIQNEKLKAENTITNLNIIQNSSRDTEKIKENIQKPVEVQEKIEGKNLNLTVQKESTLIKPIQNELTATKNIQKTDMSKVNAAVASKAEVKPEQKINLNPSLNPQTEAILSPQTEAILTLKDTKTEVKQIVQEVKTQDKTNLDIEKTVKPNQQPAINIESSKISEKQSENKENKKESNLNSKNESQLKDSKIDISVQLFSNEGATTKVGLEKTTQFDSILQSREAKQNITNLVMDQISNKITGEMSIDKSNITISLKPENLGKVEINLVSEKGVLTAQITTENAQVKDIINNSIENLRQNLIDQGVVVDKLVVQASEAGLSNSNYNSQFEQNMHKFEKANYNSTNSEFNSQNSNKQNTEQNKMNVHGEENSENLEEIYQNMVSDIESHENKQGTIDYRV